MVLLLLDGCHHVLHSFSLCISAEGLLNQNDLGFVVLRQAVSLGAYDTLSTSRQQIDEVIFNFVVVGPLDTVPMFLNHDHFHSLWTAEVRCQARFIVCS